jgi:hypothetical protein
VVLYDVKLPSKAQEFFNVSVHVCINLRFEMRGMYCVLAKSGVLNLGGVVVVLPTS